MFLKAAATSPNIVIADPSSFLATLTFPSTTVNIPPNPLLRVLNQSLGYI